MDVATRAFAEHGFQRTSMEQIAAELRVTKPRIYAYFGSKEKLYTSCVLRLWARMGEAIWSAASAPGPSELQLWRGIDAYFGFIGENMSIWRMVYADVALAGTAPNEELRQAQGAAVEMMATLLRRGAEEGTPDAPIEEVAPFAQAFVGAATALSAWWIEHPDEPRELQSLRLMNFAWVGFESLLAGRFWRPEE